MTNNIICFVNIFNYLVDCIHTNNGKDLNSIKDLLYINTNCKCLIIEKKYR